jgi:putative addiction module CopG family antidote
MNVALRPELKKFVEKEVKAGRYESVDDVLAAAVTRLMQEDQGIDFKPGELQALIDKGEADIARGDVLTLSQVRKRFHQRRSAGVRKHS